MAKLAALILTYNEIRHIADCIAGVAFADEVVVIDSGSTDGTQQAARDCGATVIEHPMTEGFAAQRNFALSTTDAEWVLFVDADERVSGELAAEIQAVVAGNEPCAYEIPRLNILFGVMMRYGAHAPDRVLRFFPRNAVVWQGRVHEGGVASVPVKRLRYPFYHYTYSNWDLYFAKFNQYTTLSAQQMHERGKKARFGSDVVIRPVYAFVRMYLFKRGFLDGRLGLIMSVMHGFYTMIKYVKLYFMNKSVSDDQNTGN